MFKSTIRVAGLALVLSGMTGCAFAPTGSPIGLLYNGTAVNHAVTSNPLGTKTGEACAITILGLVTLGDASATTAAHLGGITRISVVDGQDTNIVGVYGSHCTEVRGD